MKTFDELLTMSESEREAYRREEVERVIASADPKHTLKLRALQAKIDKISRTTVHPLACASKIVGMMNDKMIELNEAFKSAGFGVRR